MQTLFRGLHQSTGDGCGPLEPPEMLMDDYQSRFEMMRKHPATNHRHRLKMRLKTLQAAAGMWAWNINAFARAISSDFGGRSTHETRLQIFPLPGKALTGLVATWVAG